MQRASVVGTSGVGKSTVSRELARRLGASWLELDSVYHQAGWTPLDPEEFRARVAAAAAGERWVIDGGYSVVRDLVWARADTVVWLDLPRRTVMRRITWRTLRRVAGRAELWNGNRERWRNLFTWDKNESVIAWAWQTYDSRRERYTALAADPANAHLTFVRLKNPRAVRQFLRTAGASADRRRTTPNGQNAILAANRTGDDSGSWEHLGFGVFPYVRADMNGTAEPG